MRTKQTAAVVLFLASLALTGCAGFRESIAARVDDRINRQMAALRQHARDQVRNQLAERSDEIVGRVADRLKNRVSEELTARGIDPAAVRAQVREAAAEANVDVEKLKQDVRQDVKGEAATLAADVLDKVFGEKTANEWKQEIATEAGERGKASALEVIASRVGPAAGQAAGLGLAGALGLSGPIGTGIGGGLWLVARAIHRRRKERRTVAEAKPATEAAAGPPDLEGAGGHSPAAI